MSFPLVGQGLEHSSGVEGLCSVIKIKAAAILSSQHHQRERGDNCVLLGLVSAEPGCVLGYATLLHTTVPTPCLPNVTLK